MIELLKQAEQFATVVIAIYVAFIGTAQSRTARAKFRLDLYERRLNIYLSAIDLWQALTEWGELPDEQRAAKRRLFIHAVRESRFLFADNPSVLRTLEEINKRSFKITGFVEELSRWAETNPEGYVIAYNEKEESVVWITEALNRLESKLTPYLAFEEKNIKHWRKTNK